MAFLGDLVSDVQKDLGAVALLLEAVLHLVHLDHELVKVDAALLLQRELLEEQVHAERLPGAWSAPNVEPPREERLGLKRGGCRVLLRFPADQAAHPVLFQDPRS